MSDVYRTAWDILSMQFNPPMNFTDACNDQYLVKRVGYVECPTICVTIVDTVTIMGKFYEKIYRKRYFVPSEPSLF